jgi:tetratricopeptide (TPR) repeat protein
LLAVRAARRAVAADPEDVGSYLVLARAYRRLASATRERAWAREFTPLLGRVRVVQQLTALHNALHASPNARQAAEAHEDLARLYLTLNYHDVALKHFQEQLRHTRAVGPQPAETPLQFDKRIAALTTFVNDFEKEVRHRLEDYEAISGHLRPHEKARRARANGLAGKALDALLASGIETFGTEGMQMQLDLMLTTGRVKDVGEWLEPGHKDRLGPFDYHLTRAQVAAAVGDYAEADRELSAAQKSLVEVVRPDATTVPAPTEAGLTLARLLLDGLQEDKRFAWRLTIPSDPAGGFQRLYFLTQRLREAADTAVLRGLLALECGETDRAGHRFREALAFWGDAAGRPSPSGIDFPCRAVAQQCLALIRRSAKKGSD